jgi:hypothetical protein
MEFASEINREHDLRKIGVVAVGHDLSLQAAPRCPTRNGSEAAG